VIDESGAAVRHPQVEELFERIEDGRYLPKQRQAN